MADRYPRLGTWSTVCRLQAAQQAGEQQPLPAAQQVESDSPSLLLTRGGGVGGADKSGRFGGLPEAILSYLPSFLNIP